MYKAYTGTESALYIPRRDTQGGTHTPILRNRGAFTLETLTPNKLFTSFINYTSSKVFGLLVFSKHLSA